MAHTQSDVIVRLMQRKSNGPLVSLQDWRELQWTTRARRVGSGTIQVPRHEITTAVNEQFDADNLAIYIRHEVEVPGIVGEHGHESTIVTEFHGPVRYRHFNGASEMYRFDFMDNLSYFQDRVVYSDGVASVDPGGGTSTCVEYCRTLINSELLSPSDGTRAIDVPAELGGLAAGGAITDLAVRWEFLSDVIERALTDGSCFITAPLISDTVTFKVNQVDDQTAGSGGTVAPLSQDLSGSDVMYAVNHHPVKNRIYVLGDGTGASRNTTERTASTVNRLREMVVDARHLTDTAAREALGDVTITQMSEAEVNVRVSNVDRTMNVTPGMRVTVAEEMGSDATAPDIGPVDVLVMAKTYQLAPNQIDNVTIEVGHEDIGIYRMLADLKGSGQAAAFE